MSVWPFSLVLLPPVTVESLAPSPQLAPCRQCKILPWSSVLQTIHVHSACPLKTYSVPDPSLNTLSVLKSFVSCGTQNWTLNPDAGEQVLYEKKSWVIWAGAQAAAPVQSWFAAWAAVPSFTFLLSRSLPSSRELVPSWALPSPGQCRVSGAECVCPFLPSQGPSEWPCCPAA